jgi:glycolate oxidase iron-sulfur subunit
VALLIGCVSSVAFADLNRATVRVLTKNGIEVHIPKAQSCCGALHLHGGYLEMARALARRNIDAMLSPEFDAVVTNAAGCGSVMKEYAALLEHDAEYADRAGQFVAKVRDISEYLNEVGLKEPARKLKARVTYQDPCHLAHAQGIRKAPRELLKFVNELSMKILDEKMDNIAMVEPEVIVTANVGCALQFAAGVKRKGLNARVAHVVELLDEAY